MKKQKLPDPKLIGPIKELFRTNPTKKHLVRHVEGGFNLVTYLMDATTAAEKVGVPKGFKINPVEVYTTTKKGAAEVEVAQWILGVVEEQLKEGNLGRKSVKRQSKVRKNRA
jgi:hypothetical protein